MRLTLHNGKSHKNGKTYSTKHNDRNFNVANAIHIQADKTSNNVNWNFLKDNKFLNLDIEFTQSELKELEPLREATNENLELYFYKMCFSPFLDKQNEKHKKSRHKERIKTIKQYYKAKNTSPEETIFQIGNREKTIEPELLNKIFLEFLDWHRRTFPRCFILDYNLHQDEQGAPHIHFRKCWIAVNENGDLIVSMSKSLEQMGIKPSGIKENKPKSNSSKYYNKQITYTKMNRDYIFELCKKYDLNLEQDPKEKSLVGKTLTEFKINQELATLNNIKNKRKKEIKELEEKVCKVKSVGIEYQNLTNQILKDKFQFESLESLDDYINEKVKIKMESEIKTKKVLLNFIKENDLIRQFNYWQKQKVKQRVTP